MTRSIKGLLTRSKIAPEDVIGDSPEDLVSVLDYLTKELHREKHEMEGEGKEGGRNADGVASDIVSIISNICKVRHLSSSMRSLVLDWFAKVSATLEAIMQCDDRTGTGTGTGTGVYKVGRVRTIVVVSLIRLQRYAFTASNVLEILEGDKTKVLGVTLALLDFSQVCEDGASIFLAATKLLNDMSLPQFHFGDYGSDGKSDSLSRPVSFHYLREVNTRVDTLLSKVVAYRAIESVVSITTARVPLAEESLSLSVLDIRSIAFVVSFIKNLVSYSSDGAEYYRSYIAKESAVTESLIVPFILSLLRQHYHIMGHKGGEEDADKDHRRSLLIVTTSSIVLALQSLLAITFRQRYTFGELKKRKLLFTSSLLRDERRVLVIGNSTILSLLLLVNINVNAFDLATEGGEATGGEATSACTTLREETERVIASLDAARVREVLYIVENFKEVAVSRDLGSYTFVFDLLTNVDKVKRRAPSGKDIPEGWTVGYMEDSGGAYYLNNESKETRWTNPVSSKVLEVERSKEASESIMRRWLRAARANLQLSLPKKSLDLSTAEVEGEVEVGIEREREGEGESKGDYAPSSKVSAKEASSDSNPSLASHIARAAPPSLPHGTASEVTGTVADGKMDAAFMREITRMKSVPREFLCNINGHVMRHPVHSPSGVYYERDTIKLWLREIGARCPITKGPLREEDLIENYDLSMKIYEWSAQALTYSKDVGGTEEEYDIYDF